VIVAAQGAAGDPAANWREITACAASQSTSQRHDCVDAVLRRAGVLSDQQVVQATREDFGRENRQPERAQATRPAVPEQPAAAVAAAPTGSPPTRAAELARIESTVSAVRTVGFERYLIITAEGQVWEQTQARSFNLPPKVGDAFTIERAAMESFLCKFGGNRAYRCQRVD